MEKSLQAESNIQSAQPKKSGFLSKIIGKKEEEFNAEVAWYCSTHGNGSYKSLAERIQDKQNDIRRTIKSKYAPGQNENIVKFSSYHCVVDIEEDLVNYADEVFRPFIDGDFDVINLSEKCPDIDSEGVYFISWKNVFKKKHNK